MGFGESYSQILENGIRPDNRVAFSGCLTVPTIHIKAGEPNSTGNYAPAGRHLPAVIGIFTTVLKDEEAARRVLAHYMTHHWENTSATDNDSEDYPAAVDQEISKNFPTRYRERAWRSYHSKRFIAKTCDVAKSLSIPSWELLFA